MRDLKGHILDLVARISVEVDVMWPWPFVRQLELQALDDLAGREIFRTCVSHLEAADMVIPLLDGPIVDDGTARKIGFFYSR